MCVCTHTLGYRSIGESVPDVMMTLWNRSSTGLMAILESKQHSCSSGSVIPDTTEPCGSRTMEKPSMSFVALVILLCVFSASLAVALHS